MGSEQRRSVYNRYKKEKKGASRAFRFRSWITQRSKVGAGSGEIELPHYQRQAEMFVPIVSGEC